jgi:ABC-type phosphate/phosphonate transport system substrate-binding protein
MLSPNLGTSLVYELFENPVLQPVIVEISGGMQQVYNAFNNDLCRAAILRNHNYENLSDPEKANLKIIAKTKSLPNQTITISHRLEKNAQQIADFMVSQEGAIAAQGLLSRYSRSAPYFEITSTDRYEGIEDLLEGVVWGW